MSKALPGTHLCVDHQGNHSHYAKENCELCEAIARAERAEELLQKCRGLTAGYHTTLSEQINEACFLILLKSQASRQRKPND